MTEQSHTPPERIHSTTSWIINGLVFVGCLTLIAIALLTWVVWYDDTPSTTTTRAQTDAWQQAIAIKQVHDLVVLYSAVAMTRRIQEAIVEPEEVANGRDEPGGANGLC